MLGKVVILAAGWRERAANTVGGTFGSKAPTGVGGTGGQLQSVGRGIAQNLAVPTGTYQVDFLAIQRTNQVSDQLVSVFLVEDGNTIFIGSIQPGFTAY